MRSLQCGETSKHRRVSWGKTMAANQNFTTLQVARYVTSAGRIVDVIMSQVNVQDPRTSDTTKKVTQWTGVLYKPDGKTVEHQVLYFADGSVWQPHSMPNPNDVKTFMFTLSPGIVLGDMNYNCGGYQHV